MGLAAAVVHNPVKVAVGVLLVALFGVIALVEMPMQLTPEVETPKITIETRWPGSGATPSLELTTFSDRFITTLHRPSFHWPPEATTWLMDGRNVIVPGPAAPSAAAGAFPEPGII